MRAINFYQLRRALRARTAATLPTASPVAITRKNRRHIPVEYGNLGSKLHYALRIPVRIVRRKHIEVTHHD